MSLESEIKTLTAAVQQLTEVLRNQAQMPLAFDQRYEFNNLPVAADGTVEISNSDELAPKGHSVAAVRDKAEGFAATPQDAKPKPQGLQSLVEQKAVLEVAADNTVTVTPVAATLEDCKAAFRVWTKQYSDMPPKEQHAHGAALLAKFGAAKLPDLKPESYAAFVAACGGA